MDRAVSGADWLAVDAWRIRAVPPVRYLETLAVSWADRKLHGGFGAMLDDVLAGVYAFLVLQTAAHFLR